MKEVGVSILVRFSRSSVAGVGQLRPSMIKPLAFRLDGR